jgi:hypothetical protein
MNDQDLSAAEILTAITEGDRPFVVYGWTGVAWRYSGPVIDHVEPEYEWDDDYGGGVWAGCEQALEGDVNCTCPHSTTEVYAVMIGDDRRFVHDLDDIVPIDDDDHCPGCGSTTCGHYRTDQE